MDRTITVRGMRCEGCEASVIEALEDLDEVETAHADRERAKASVSGDAAVGDLLAAVEQAGYEATA